MPGILVLKFAQCRGVLPYAPANQKGVCMFFKHNIHQIIIMTACLAVIGIAGCKGKSEASKPETAVTPAMIRSLPTVELTGTKILENPALSTVGVEIIASGTFGSNVVPKNDPERIIVVLHNATKGKTPPEIKVNNGTINRVAIDELNTGKGTAVRITIGLVHKSDYVVTPVTNGLMIDVRR